MKTLFIVLVLFSSIATADEIVINLKSYHINSVFDFNENNFGLGYRWKHTDDNWFLDETEIGFFRNSYYHLNTTNANGNGYSYYVKTSIWTPYVSRYLRINTDLGLAYYGNDGIVPLMPLLHITADVAITNSIIIKFGFAPMPFKTYNIEEDGTITQSTMVGILTLSASYMF